MNVHFCISDIALKPTKTPGNSDVKCDVAAVCREWNLSHGSVDWRGSAHTEEVSLSLLVWIRSHCHSKRGSVDIQTKELLSSPNCSSVCRASGPTHLWQQTKQHPCTLMGGCWGRGDGLTLWVFIIGLLLVVPPWADEEMMNSRGADRGRPSVPHLQQLEGAETQQD